MITAMDTKDEIELSWLIGRSLRIILIVPPLHVIDDYDYNVDNNDFNTLIRISTIWFGTSDIIRGLLDTTVGNFTVS